MVISFMKHHHGVNPREFLEGNLVAAAYLGHHLNICRLLFGLKIENCAYIEDKLLTRWTHPMDISSNISKTYSSSMTPKRIVAAVQKVADKEEGVKML